MERDSAARKPVPVPSHPPLAPDQLRAKATLQDLPEDLHEEGPASPGSFHQPRAEQALALGATMANAGHIFVTGPSGTARKELIDASLSRHARAHAPLRDYLSVCSPGDPRSPAWLWLPAGKGRAFRDDVAELLRACEAVLRGPDSSAPAAPPTSAPAQTRHTPDATPIEDAVSEIERRYGADACGGFLARLRQTLAEARQGSCRAPFRLSAYAPRLVREAPPREVPRIFEPHPTLWNLFGYVSHEAAGAHGPGGGLHWLEAGSLLRAQGGFLVVDFAELAAEPGAWKHLKRCLEHGLLDLPLPESSQPPSMAYRKPEAVPLEVRVVAWGDEALFRAFQGEDPAFARVFRIRADLDTEMAWSRENVAGYLRFLRRRCRQEGLLPFHRTGTAAFVECGAERAESQTKLTVEWEWLADLAREASHAARQDGSLTVRACHVERASDQRRYRHSLPEEQLQELILEDALRIQTDGAEVGQVNGITLYETEDHLFGKPCRITAQTGTGRSGVINIEREASLSGKLHDKGMLILCGFLRSRYAADKPMNLSASLCVEQLYAEIDGDSASLGEACALLSSLAGIPLRQGFAVTGSISQRGEVQAVGCVTEKVAGFFDVCRQRGLTGGQGVILPASNRPDLMLPRRVVEAVERGLFQLYAVESVDDAMEILTGRVMGRRDREGQFPEGSLNALVDERLRQLASNLRDTFLEEDEAGEGEGPVD